MKKILFSLIAILLITSSCSDDELAMPSADFLISETEVGINETVTFKYTGMNATQIVVFPGDEGHDWTQKDNGNTGLVMSKGVMTYAYKKAGVYTATIVATTYNDQAQQSNVATKNVQIVVKDDDNTLQSVILQKDLYNKEMQATLTDSYVLVCLPYKVNVKNKDIAVKMDAQRLSISAYSSNAVVTVNGEPHDVQKKYNLTQTNTIEVTAASGYVRKYDMYTIHYPTFEKFALAGVEGKVTYSPYNFDKSYINISLPKGTDVSSLVPVFASADAKSVIVEGIVQQSGQNSLDFTTPVTFRLMNSVPFHDEIECVSEVIVSVTVNK